MENLRAAHAHVCMCVRTRVPACPPARLPNAFARLSVCASAPCSCAPVPVCLCACAPVRLRTGRLAGGQAGGWVGVGVGLGVGCETIISSL